MLDVFRLYGFDAILVPAADRMVGNGVMHACTAAGRLRTARVAQLHASMAKPLELPTDWRREARLTCW